MTRPSLAVALLLLFGSVAGALFVKHDDRYTVLALRDLAQQYLDPIRARSTALQTSR